MKLVYYEWPGPAHEWQRWRGNLASLGPTPPMGGNGWDSFRTSVSDDDGRSRSRPSADLVIDVFGRLMPAVNRVCSAANGGGFKPLADEVHGKGLKFGIHIMRGIPRPTAEANLLEDRRVRLRSGNSGVRWVDLKNQFQRFVTWKPYVKAGS